MYSFINYFIFLVLLVTYASVSNVLAQDHEVCSERMEDALSSAIRYHHKGTAEIAVTRGMGQHHILDVRGRTIIFERMVQKYLSDVPASAFMLYAADTEHICVFLWRNDIFGFRYQRVKSTGEELSRLSELVRARILAGSEQTSRAPKRRGLTPVKKTSTPVDSRTTPELIEALSEIIFPQGLRNELKGIRVLSIAPIQNLSSVPMAILQPFGDTQQVIDLFSVNFIAFVDDLQDGVVPSRPTYKNSLIIGNPRPSNDPEWIFPNLPGAEDEAELAHATFGGTLLSREQATRDAFISDMQDADLIYVAAHAMSNPLGPLDESFIALAQNRLSAPQVQVEFLHRHPLVVLSGCQTAQGRMLDAGIIGIARAFQIANAANTVMSLWNIDDDATLFLMRYFIVNLKSGLPPAESMRLAMIATREYYPEPRYWAAFNVFGNHSALMGTLMR